MSMHGRRPRFDVAFYAPAVAKRIVEDRESAGGAETQILLLARGLATRGWRVALVSYAAGRPVPHMIDGVHVVAHRRFRGRRVLVRRLAYAAEIARMLATLDAAVLVQRSAGSVTGLVGFAARIRRRRFVYSSSSVVDFALERIQPDRRVVALYEFGVRLATDVVVQTDEQVELCRRRFHREPVLIRSIAEPAERRTAVPDAFLWIGRVDGYKRPEAFVELARAVPEARFRMVAVPAAHDDGRGLRHLRELGAELDNLEFLDARPRREILALVERAVAIVNTSDIEGMPNTFLEGWARGVPALTLVYDPNGVIVREGLGRAAQGSIDVLARHARELWAARRDQREISAACRDYIAREHALDAAVEQWERALRLTGNHLGAPKGRSRARRFVQ
jgi:glycosyltransferase involved in cell wall biosynthesis